MKKRKLWRKKGNSNNSNVIEAEAEEKEPEVEPPRFTATDPCTKDQQKEIRDLIAEVADYRGAKKKEVSAEIMKKFGFDGFDQVDKEKAEEIKEYLRKEKDNE